MSRRSQILNAMQKAVSDPLLNKVTIDNIIQNTGDICLKEYLWRPPSPEIRSILIEFLQYSFSFRERVT